LAHHDTVSELPTVLDPILKAQVVEWLLSPTGSRKRKACSGGKFHLWEPCSKGSAKDLKRSPGKGQGERDPHRSVKLPQTLKVQNRRGEEIPGSFRK
jgi:hypothetical protein